MSCIEPVVIGEQRYAPDKAGQILSFNFNGVEGLSLGQLIMAVCINRSAALERATVVETNKLAETAGLIEALAMAVDLLMKDGTLALEKVVLDLSKTTYIPKKCSLTPTLEVFLTEEMGVSIPEKTAIDPNLSNSVFNEDKLNNLNSIVDVYIANAPSANLGELARKVKNILQNSFLPTIFPTKLKNLMVNDKILEGVTLEKTGAYEYSDVAAQSYSVYDLICHEMGLPSYLKVNQKIQIFNQLKEKMDSATRLSKSQAIDLQSLVNWRDVTYNMSATITGALMSDVLDMADKC